MTLNVVFDVDGVLVDSRELNKAAYSAVGVKMPDEAFGKPWRHWLVDYCGGDLDKAKYLHVKKQQWYGSQSLSREQIPVLPAANIARSLLMLGTEINIKFISSSSESAMRMNVAYAGLPFVYCDTRACEMGPGAKNSILSNIPGGGVYVDDVEDLGRRCVASTAFTLVRFSGQTTIELMDEIWTQLYSQREKVLGSQA